MIRFVNKEEILTNFHYFIADKEDRSFVFHEKKLFLLVEIEKRNFFGVLVVFVFLFKFYFLAQIKRNHIIASFYFKNYQNGSGFVQNLFLKLKKWKFLLVTIIDKVEFETHSRLRKIFIEYDLFFQLKYWIDVEFFDKLVVFWEAYPKTMDLGLIRGRLIGWGQGLFFPILKFILNLFIWEKSGFMLIISVFLFFFFLLFIFVIFVTMTVLLLATLLVTSLKKAFVYLLIRILFLALLKTELIVQFLGHKFVLVL